MAQRRRKPLVDDDGTAITAGCTLHFGYGIPPVSVNAKVIERDGDKLIALIETAPMADAA